MPIEQVRAMRDDIARRVRTLSVELDDPEAEARA